jgi:hypothetical protein
MGSNWKGRRRISREWYDEREERAMEETTANIDRNVKVERTADPRANARL